MLADNIPAPTANNKAMHGVAMVMFGDRSLVRNVSEAQILQATYELADASCDEIKAIAKCNRLKSDRLMARAHFIRYLSVAGADKAAQLLADLRAELR